jgi:hypothetical protein
MKAQSPSAGRALRPKRSAPIDKATTSNAKSIGNRPAKATGPRKYLTGGNRLNRFNSLAAGITSHAGERPVPSLPRIAWLDRPLINDGGGS